MRIFALALLLVGCGHAATFVPQPQTRGSSSIAVATPSQYDALGDSITYGLYDPVGSAYPHVLGKYLPAPVQDLGITGATAVGMVTSELPKMIPACTLVTLNAGTNDHYYIQQKKTETLAQYESAMLSLVNGAHTACPNAQIVVSTVVIMPSSQYLNESLKVTMNKWIATIPTLVPFPVVIVDLNADQKLHYQAGTSCLAMYNVDCLHPNVNGQLQYEHDFWHALYPTRS